MGRAGDSQYDDVSGSADATKLSVLVKDATGTGTATKELFVSTLATIINGGGGGGGDSLTSLRTLTGTSASATHLGVFSGATIPDAATVKAALQALETVLEGKAATAHTHAISDVTNLQATIDAISGGRRTSTIQGLKSLTGASNGETVEATGYYAAGDCERLLYVWSSASTATDDGIDSSHPGLVIQPTGVAGAGRWIAALNGRVNVRWYGASPNESNNQPYIQRAVREAIHQSSLPKAIFIPAGSYTCTAGILCKKDSNADFHPEAFSLLIEGEAGMPYGLSGMTKLVFTHTDTFGIGIQLGKGIRIRRIELDGMNNVSFATPRAAFTDSESGYVTGGCRDNSLSPYAGIAIDPFGPSSISAGNRYPGYSSEYPSGHTAGGSTEIKIEDCKISGFVTNIVLSPNGYTQNAEQVECVRVWSDQCKVAFAIGQLQSRSVHLRDCTAWGNVLWWIDCTGYGAGSGAMPYVHGGNIAGHLKYLGRCTGSAVAQAQIENLYAESIYSLGTYSIDVLTFRSCLFQWSLSSSTVATPHCFIRSTKAVAFKDCLLIHSANPPNTKPLVPYCDRISYDGCTFDAPPAEVSVNSVERAIHRNSRFRHLGSAGEHFGYYSTGAIVFASPKVNTNRMLVGPGTVLQAPSLAIEFSKAWTIGGTYPHRFDDLNGGAVTVTSIGNGDATFTTPNPARCGAGMTVVVGINVADEFGFSHAASAYISNVSGTTVTLSGLPPQFVTGSYWVSVFTYYRWHDDCIGSTTNGSPTITDVRANSSLTGIWAVGDYISGAGIPQGSYVAARDNTAKTITLNQNATATATGVDLYDAIIAKCHAVAAYQPDTGSWRKGTVVDDSTGATNGWRCTASGTFGSGTDPTFAAR